ncbi:DEAD/DEAH box helicase [Fictibacillus aquaticus]|uniref:DEAD/DEAH box helicase n=1 Tax=Fictibacillus aquaticus TaxID=2021314 RepID=A0A235FEJ8_9BACL|nr:DEAD/DEAH box helicase [Fictibacillus aquaticus]OYD59374.1 hypothetical protein CGZ90_05655 [Fictibacillus aquaticus]
MPLICQKCLDSGNKGRDFYQISRRFKNIPFKRNILQATNGIHKKDWVKSNKIDLKPDGIYCGQCNISILENLMNKEEIKLLKDYRIESWNPSEFPLEIVLQKLKIAGNNTGAEVEHYSVPKRTAQFGDIRTSLPEPITKKMNEFGIKKLYSHQAEAINDVRDGKNVVIVSGTASGKSLVYTLPALEQLFTNENATILYLSPLKALTHDQLKTLSKWNDDATEKNDLNGYKKIKLGGKEISIGVLESGNGEAAKELTYKNARYWMTNIHFLHYLLQGPYHYRNKGNDCTRFFANLKYVVLDELHAYNGVLGSKVSMVMRRLRMLCKKLGNTSLQFIACSASIGNPKELAEELTGLKGIRGFTLIDKDGSPSFEKEILMWNPALLENKKELRTRRAPVSEAIEILKHIVSEHGILPKTLLFYGNRRATSTASFELNRAIRSRIIELNDQRDIPNELFSPFHAQLTTIKKHQLMNQLKQGELIGLVSTSALEMGIDIGDLSLCIMVGYSGSKASFLQQAGRVGRNGPGLVIQIFQEDPLEQYYAKNPIEFIEREPEHVTIDVNNPNIISEHLKYAAYEQNGTLSLPQSFFRVGNIRKVEGFLDSWDVKESKWKLKPKKITYNNLLINGRVYKVVLKNGMNTETLLEGVDERSLLRDYHNGAVFLHEEKTYKVQRIIQQSGEIHVIQQRFEYTTRSHITDSLVLKEKNTKSNLGEIFELGKGTFELIRRMWGFKKVSLYGGQIIEDLQESNMYPVKYSTDGLWINLLSYDDFKQYLTESSIHVLEHAIASAIPTIVKCSNSDFGVISSVSMKEFSDLPTLVIYETGGGGAGIVDAVEERFIHILRKASGILNACSCTNGCPNCTHLSGCEQGNERLDKQGGIKLLELLQKNINLHVNSLVNVT